MLTIPPAALICNNQDWRQNGEAHKAQEAMMGDIKRGRLYQAIFLTTVASVSICIVAWRLSTHETYESCLKEAAQSAKGVHRAYADLRDICDNRETERLIEKSPSKKAGLFDDIPPEKPTGK